MPVPGLPRFTGGAVGFIGYEFIHDVEPVVPRPPHDDLRTPTMYFLIADELLIFDRVRKPSPCWSTPSSMRPATPRKPTKMRSAKSIASCACSNNPVEHTPVTLPDEVPPHVLSNPTSRRRNFSPTSLKAKEYITAGDIIQVVGSQRFSTPVKASAAGRLSRGAFDQSFALHVPAGAGWLFAGGRFAGNPCALREPQSGDSPDCRHAAARQDAGARTLANEKDLLADPKERAEHVMLVDLARNDIGRVCDFGCVQVKDLMIIERYSHVMHIVSQVEGHLSDDNTRLTI